jgi:hypothetical protein
MAFSRTLQHFTSSQELATQWASGQSYILDQLVLDNDKLYRCILAHTSGTFQTDYANSNWVEISSGLVPWITAVYYTANQFVEQGNDIYRCLISHTSGTFATDLVAGRWVEVSAGSGSGLKNYVVNGDFEQNTDTGWSLARSTLDATTKLPNQVAASWTSAAGTLAKSVISSGQLAGSYSLQLSSTAATTAGDMLVTNALALDLEAQASVQTFSFFYRVTSNGTGTPNFSGTSANAIGVAIYDVTNGAWIQPAGVFNLVQSSGVGKAAGTFQCPSNCTSVRLAVYFPNSTAASGGSPFTVVFDDFVLGPQVVQYGAPVTDFGSTPWSPVSTWNAGTTVTGTWRRVGDELEGYVKVSITNAGLVPATNLFVNLPSGYTIDTSKLLLGTAGYATTVGRAELYNASGGAAHTAQVFYNTSSQIGVFYTTATNGAQGNVTPSAPFSFINNSSVHIYFSVPVVGLSSSVQMSNDTDTRVVAARYEASSHTGAMVAGVVNYDTKIIDTHNAVTTGPSWRFTAPVSGFYRVAGQIEANSSGAGTVTVQVRKNGASSAQSNGPVNAATNFVTPQAESILSLSAGDYIEIVETPSTGTWTRGGIPSTNYVNIERISGPATIAASETVAASYGTSAAPSIPHNSATIVVYPTRQFDTHGMMNTSTGVVTIPVSGKYLISAGHYFASAIGATATDVQTICRKNGFTVQGTNVPKSGTSAGPLATQGTFVVQCNAGDTIGIFLLQANSAATAQSLLASAEFNYMTITRVGN